MTAELFADRTRPRVVVVGGGFAGLRVVRGLRHTDAEVILLDRVNHHLFQPLLYQVATAVLPPGDIAPALRQILADQANAKVVLGEVTAVHPKQHAVEVTTAEGTGRRIHYDHLVVAAGAVENYFGHNEWAPVAPPMKTLDHAIGLRARLLRAFEAAVVSDHSSRRDWLTFVVVGGGPTGVELAGQLAALARRTLRREFHDLDPTHLRIVLVDTGGAVLAPFPAPLRTHTRRRLQELGIDVRLHRTATVIDDRGITLAAAQQPDEDDEERIAARTVVWAAGVRPAPLTTQLAAATGAPTDHKGRIRVEPDCTVPGHPDIHAIGDMANLHDLPGIAEPAIQQGRHVAKAIAHRLGAGPDPGQFHYVDLGTMATISPLDAVADIRWLRLRGPLGKAAWAGVHLAFLVGWSNRAAVLGNWAWALATGRRRQQVILHSGAPATRT